MTRRLALGVPTWAFWAVATLRWPLVPAVLVGFVLWHCVRAMTEAGQ